jgi:hypothetical protein
MQVLLLSFAIGFHLKDYFVPFVNPKKSVCGFLVMCSLLKALFVMNSLIGMTDMIFLQNLSVELTMGVDFCSYQASIIYIEKKKAYCSSAK